MISCPRPPAANSVARTTMPSAIMMVWVTPVRMVGMAIGSWTFSSVWRVEAPNMAEASTDAAGTWRMPTVVSRTSGGRA